MGEAGRRCCAARVALAAAVTSACGRIGFDQVATLDRDAAHVPIDAPGIQLVAHTMINADSNGLTTHPIDTTSASLIVMAECTWSTGSPTVPTDSVHNTWQAGLQSYGANDNPANIKLFYAFAPVTSTTHTFTDVGNDFLSIAVLAFAGTLSAPEVLSTATGNTGNTPMQPGTVMATGANQLVLTFACSGQSVATAVTIDSGFERVDFLLNHNAGAPEDMGSAFLVTLAAGALAPAWTLTGDSEATGVIALFLPA